MRAAYLIVLMTLFAVVAASTAILISWPAITYYAK